MKVTITMTLPSYMQSLYWLIMFARILFVWRPYRIGHLKSNIIKDKKKGIKTIFKNWPLNSLNVAFSKRRLDVTNKNWDCLHEMNAKRVYFILLICVMPFDNSWFYVLYLFKQVGA